MKKLLTRLALLMILCAALALPVFADAVTDSISVCIGYFGWSEDEYVEKAKFSWQELDDWYGGALDTHEEYYSYCNGSGRTYLAFARGFYIRDLLDYAGVDVNSIASIDFFTKDHSVGAYRSFTKYALLDQPRYYFPNLAGDAETGELYAWDGGDDLWVGAYQVEPMLALEDYTEWDTAGFDFESYADESLFSTGSRFHLFFGQASPEEAATSSAAKYVYKILVTFSGTPVLSSEESNLDLVVGSDHALHVTADAEDDALTAYVQEHLQYTPSDPAVVSVDQYGRLHVNAEGDAVITASFGESSVSVQVHVGSGGASGTGSAAGEGTAPGGEAGTGQLDLPQPDETEAAPVTGPVDARSVYVLAGSAVSTGENGTTAGEGMQDGSWTGPNWTPIGGKFPMKSQEASGDCLTLDTRFNGVLDGQGHTIYNLYCDRCAAKGFPYSMAVGVVGFLGGNADYANGGNGEKTEAEFKNGWQPAVRNLVLGSGSIYGRRIVGGIVGRVGETSNGVVIENCGNRADVRNTDSKGVGGICGSAWGAGTIRGCYNTGTISTTYTCPAGGILGTNEGMDVYNCYNAGRIDTNGAQYGRGIGGHDTGSYTVAGCWYLTGCDDDPASNGYYKGTSRKISVSVTAVDQKTLQSDTVIAALNANGADVTLTNASFSGRTDSDNVALLSAGTVTVTGGTLRVEAEKSVHAVLGCVSLTNCGLYASGHSGNSAKTVSQTTGVEALQTLAQQSGVRTLAASGFADVRAEDACLQDVLTCTAAGLMTGTGQDRFSPEKPMTRAMLVTVLWRMAGSPAAQGNGGFTDLRADWYRQAAVWGAQNGIVSGTSRTTFAPDKAVTKEQACALLARFARTRGVQAAADAAPVYVAECSAWAGSDVQSAYALGIADSYAACLAAPQASVTRAELAHMLSDLLQRV